MAFGVGASRCSEPQASTLLDDFNRMYDSTASQGSVETETTVGTGMAIGGTPLKFGREVVGKDFVSRDLSTFYKPMRQQNADQLTWL